MGINIMGKVCFCIGIVIIIVGAVQGYLAYSNTVGALKSANGLGQGIKASGETNGTFTVEKLTVEINGSEVSNDITVSTISCVGSCPTVTILTDPGGTAVVCEAPAIACKCSEVNAQGVTTSLAAQTICTIKQPPIGKYSFTSDQKIMIISEARVQADAMGVLGGAVSAFWAFAACGWFCGCGIWWLCITFVCYECCGNCQEEEDEEASEELEPLK